MHMYCYIINITKEDMKYSQKILLLTFCSMLFTFKAHSQCVNRWENIRDLAPIKGIDFNKIFAKKSLMLNAEGGGYSLRERNGSIYVQSPAGNSNVKVCKLPGNKLKVTATVLGISRSVIVEITKGKNGVIHADGYTIPFNATY